MSKITDIPTELFDELDTTKERLKYISSCTQNTYNDPRLKQTYNLVTHDQLDLLIINTKELVLDIIEELLETDAIKYFSSIKRVVNDRIERNSP